MADITITTDFGGALDYLRRGHRVARKGWNGKGMFLFLVPGSTFNVDREPMLTHFGVGTEITYHSHIDMKTVDGSVVPWLASQTDLLAEDWVLFDHEHRDTKEKDTTTH